MRRITLILLNFRRPENLSTIIASIRGQSTACDVFLWNNSGERVDESQFDWVVNSSENRFCWPRWFMATYAKTEYIASLDDDLCFKTADALSELVASLDQHAGEGRLVGIEGVILDGDHPYLPLDTAPLHGPSPHGLGPGSVHILEPEQDMAVDIVKGRLLALRREDLAHIHLTSQHQDVCDDIALSGLLAKGRRRPHWLSSRLGARCQDLADTTGAMALSRRADWRDVRNAAKETYFPTPSADGPEGR